MFAPRCDSAPHRCSSQFLDDDVLLDLTLTDVPDLRRLGLPFRLTRQR